MIVVAKLVIAAKKAVGCFGQILDGMTTPRRFAAKRKWFGGV